MIPQAAERARPSAVPARSRPAGRYSSLSARLTRHASALALLTATLLTLGVYGRALGFSYFLDEPYDLTRTEGRGYWELISRPFQDYVYYRPLTFVIWKAVHDLSGGYDSVILHLIPLLVHALSAWLVFLIARRLTGSLWALLPMLLFVVYPFSFQGVIMIGTLFHPLVTLALLAMLLLWHDGRAGGSAWRMAAATGCAMLALWTHEYGALAVPLLLLSELYLWRRGIVARPTPWLLAPLAAELLYLALWFSFDKAPPDDVPAGEMANTGSLWLQDFGYPLSRQALWLSEQTGLSWDHLTLALAALGIAVAAGAYWRGQRLVLGAGLLAVGLLVFLPAIFRLRYEYVQNSPRLLYVVAPACVIFWGLLPKLRFGRPRLDRAWRLGTLALLALVVIQSLLFIERRVTMLDDGTELVDELIATAGAAEGEPLIFMNVPSWFAPRGQEYPRGHLGVQLVPYYVPLDLLVYTATGRHYTIESDALAPRVADWRYFWQPHGPPLDHAQLDALLRAGLALRIVELDDAGVTIRDPGTLRPGAPWPTERQAVLGDALWLIDHQIAFDGDALTVSTTWFAARELTGDYQLWFQVRDRSGSVISEWRDYALAGLSPPRLWRPVDLVEDRAVLQLPLRSSHDVTVWVALVSTADGRLLPVTEASGTAVVRDWLQLPIRAE